MYILALSLSGHGPFIGGWGGGLDPDPTLGVLQNQKPRVLVLPSFDVQQTRQAPDEPLKITPGTATPTVRSGAAGPGPGTAGGPAAVRGGPRAPSASAWRRPPPASSRGRSRARLPGRRPAGEGRPEMAAGRSVARGFSEGAGGVKGNEMQNSTTYQKAIVSERNNVLNAFFI